MRDLATDPLELATQLAVFTFGFLLALFWAELALSPAASTRRAK